MSLMFELPREWFDYRTPHYFLTYYGDVYSGMGVATHGQESRFFIVPQQNIGRYIQSISTNQQLDVLKEFGLEIQNLNIITKAFPVSSIGQNIGSSSSTAKPHEDIWKKMFVFGAGASTFCAFDDKSKKFSDSKLCPPLGTDLFHDRFEEIIKNYKGAKLSIPGFIAKGNDIEACLENEWTTIKDSHSPSTISKHINLQFYLSDLFKQISKEVTENHYRTNLYSLFSSKLYDYLTKKKEETIGLVSFNYDTILEYFIEEVFRMGFKSTEDYINWNNRQIVLFKPHGSCNWGWRFKHQDFEKQNQLTIATKLYEGNIEPIKIYYELLGTINDMLNISPRLNIEINSSKANRYSINKSKIEVIPHNQAGYLPALLMPYKDKDEFIMPDAHHHALSSYLNHIEELYLIGWKGNEDVFNRLLTSRTKQLKNIVIVNPESHLVIENLSKYFKMENYSIEIVPTFEEFVLKKMDEILK